MQQNKKSPANAGTIAEAMVKSFRGRSFVSHCTTDSPETQEEIRQLLAILPTGRENAVKARKLASSLGLTTRELTRLVHDARAAGAVILSDFSHRGGFFVPSPGLIGRAETEEFVQSMSHRARAIFIAVRSARAALKDVGDDGTT